jgi:hypothetical protein
MALNNLRLSRAQIAKIVGNDPEAIKQFEKLFTLNQDYLVSGAVDDTTIDAGNALAAAGAALDRATDLESRITSLELAPVPQPDIDTAISGSIAVDDNGVEVLASATRLNFTGSGVTVTDLGGGEAEINISGGGGSVPTTVQFKSVAVGDLSTGITLDAAPTNGNLLVAIVFNATATVAPASNAGWTSADSDTNLPDHTVMYRFAGAGESATQNPTSSTDGGSIIIYEFSGALGIIAPGATTTTATVVSQSFVSSAWNLLAATTGLMIGYSGRRTAENGTLSGSFTNEVTINGASGTTGGTGVSIVADSAAKSPGASLPSLTCTWPTSAASKAGILIVY